MGAGAAERRGRAGRRDGAGQPLRQPDHRRAARRTGGCWSAARARAARRRTSTPRPGRASRRTDLSLGRPDDGLRVRRPARRERAVPRRAAPHRSSTSTSTGSARSGCGRAPSTTTAAPTTTGSRRRFRTVDVRAGRRRPATSACGARSTASRSCPTTPSGSRWTATRPTTSRSPGSSSGCDAIGQPKVVIGVSGGLDSTHALIVAAQGDGPARPPAQRHPRLHDARLRDRRRRPSPTPPGSPRRSA